VAGYTDTLPPLTPSELLGGHHTVERDDLTGGLVADAAGPLRVAGQQPEGADDGAVGHVVGPELEGLTARSCPIATHAP
jgi:hypothetical protein